MSSGDHRKIVVGVPTNGSETLLSALDKDLPIEVVVYPDLGGDLSGIRNVEFLVLQHDRPDVVDYLSRLWNLKVVQILLSGYDWVQPSLPDDALLCNARGSRDVAVSEWVMGALLGYFSGVLDAVVRQPRREWFRPRRHELFGSKVVIIGMGTIGKAIASRCEPFGIDVIGFARTARGSILSVTDLPNHLGRADAVILVTPLSDETRGLMDATMLAKMRDGALLINAGRGAVVDEGALTDELASGRLRAVLDVFDPEPLPPESPLWGLKGSFISPHIGGVTHEGGTKALLIAAQQVSRYVKGEPLEFVVGQGHGVARETGA